MPNRYEYPQIVETDEVTNDDGSLEIVSDPGSSLYIFINRLDISVYKAAQGGGGELRIQDEDGNKIWTMNVDSVKDVSLDFGEHGYRVGPGLAIQVIVYGAQTSQASAYISLVGYKSFRG